MTDLLIEHKWVFLIGAEIFFWVCAAAFFLARYWFEMGRLGNLLLVLIVVEEVLANLFILGLGALDYRQAGQVTSYQVVTVAFILYALTLGRHDARRLDAYLKRKSPAGKVNLCQKLLGRRPSRTRRVGTDEVGISTLQFS